MRLIHTSDWHLGRSFHGVGLLPAQAAYLDHLVEEVAARQVDAVLIAGDVYDRALPPPDAVELLSRTVTRLIDAGAAVVISSGNHDSAIRLGFAADLLARAGLHIRSDLDSIGTPVLLADTAIYPLPYLEPTSTSVLQALGVEERSHAAVLSAAMDRVRADAAGRGPRTVVMAHCFAGGGASSDSERSISTGGVEIVAPTTFDGVAYAALGHLHRPQQVSERVRYSGSPVAMSFSEAGYTKGSLVVDLAEDGSLTVEHLAAPVLRPLRVIRGEIDTLLTDDAFTEAEGAWVRAVLTDPVRPRAALDRLRTRFPHLVDLDFDPQGATTAIRSYAAKLARREPFEVCCDFVAEVRHGAVADEAERELLRLALEAGRRDQKADEGGVRGGSAAGAA
ncbi:exonuclease SbcCD subunit D [Janibacter sp. GXQ6167]|uniref:exonuclease SbcCD subunit D n=1 Tax=Janibacter sp. GXQ6167 TaxID=3240791 RepID=UPI00352578AA